MTDNSQVPNPKQVVEHGYDQAADAYARLEQDSTWPRMRWLNKLLDRLQPGAAVLDLGCGSGDPADVAIAQQHQVTGIDISQAQITRARQNVPSGTFLQADLAAVTFPAATFDAVVSFYTLEHLPREEHLTILQRISDWLKPGGLLLLATEASETGGALGTWLDVPMYFSSFDAETVMRMVGEAGLAIRETAVESQQEQGQAVSYLWVLAQKV
jgi:cyclopropane fatty-acyl-phospholipid synthase-like methyltransferase